MPRYRTEVEHTYGETEALSRVRTLAEHARRNYDLKGEWSDNTLNSSLVIQGVSLQGKLIVESNVIRFDGHLPFVAIPFKRWLPRALKKGLEQSGPGGSVRFETSEEQPVALSVSNKETEGAVVLFLHIPKAGGSTLGEYVYNQCRAQESYNDGQLDSGVAYLDYGFIKDSESTIPAHVVDLLGRRDLRAVIGHFWFGLHEHVKQPSRYITILRDPVERVVSLYYFTKLQHTMSLEEFARNPPFREVDNDQTRRIAGVNPPVGECTQSTLETARENLRRYFAVVGTTERMTEVLAHLRTKLGWNRDVVSVRRNVNADRPARGSLTQEAIKAVRERNELDYELWRYASDLFDEDVASERMMKVGRDVLALS